MGEKIIGVPQLAWHEPRELLLSFPETWDVQTLNMSGYQRPALTTEQIRQAVVRPGYGRPIGERVRAEDEVAILFDDLTRVTRVAQIVPFILEELHGAGVPKGQIRFIAALGCHGALNRSDLVKKLGADVVENYAVYNHNAFENCVYAGTTAGGVPLYINEEFMRCTFKIGIGAITPHIMAGFGGGGKIVLPGIASIETAEAFHRVEKARQRVAGQEGETGMGVFENNPLQREIQEATVLAGLDFSINCLVNQWGETVSIFAGEPIPSFIAGATEAKPHYLTPRVTDADIAVANTFAKASEALIGLFISCGAVSERGGDVILICNSPEGQVPHFLMGTFGKHSAGRSRLAVGVPPQVGRLIILNEYPEFAARNYFNDQEKIFFARSWEEVRKLLGASDGCPKRVVVFPDASIQYSKTS